MSMCLQSIAWLWSYDLRRSSQDAGKIAKCIQSIAWHWSYNLRGIWGITRHWENVKVSTEYRLTFTLSTTAWQFVPADELTLSVLSNESLCISQSNNEDKHLNSKEKKMFDTLWATFSGCFYNYHENNPVFWTRLNNIN